MSKKKIPRAKLLEALMEEGRNLGAATVMFHAAVAERAGLNATDHKCAEILVRAGPLTAGELADRTGLTTGAITGVIDRLEAAGFVSRAKDPHDRRRVIVQPHFGCMKEKLTPLFARFAPAMQQLHESYADEDVEVILDYMKRCGDVLRRSAAELRENR